MGKKTKVGKQRKDKYYQRAKEAGYRSRAAFKLIQLNRQFEFLQKSRVCIDLCAAPGGWMQVAKQNMPLSSIVLGVDLYPIKPIPGCISVTEDITTEKCRTTLAKELKTWKADVVLHDGAPNVGKNWLYDAFQQACLTLSALKLATSFLRSGGWFITKVFRSKDYHPLIWVLKQFFKKVHQTKPAASRNESAEIFVVCQHYLAPAKFDPKFMDPKYVFEEVEIEPKNLLNVFHPEKKQKKKPEGYPDNDISLYHKLNASDFIGHPTGIELLAVASEIVFDDPDILEHKKTTNEIKECCKDIKVLGRKELKNLLSWRKSLHEEFAEKKPKNGDKAILEGEDDEDKEQTDDVKDEEEQDEVLKEADVQILELQKEEHRELKRKKKNVLKERRKLNEKLNLKMVIKGDSGPTMEADGLFELKKIKDSNELNKLLDKQPDVVAEEEKDLTPKSKYLKYDKDEQHLDSSGLYYKNSDSELEFESEDDDDDEDQPKGKLGYSDSDDDSDSLSALSTKEDGESSEHPLITDLDYRKKDVKRAHKSELFFQRDAFKDLIDDKTMDIDLKKFKEKLKEKGAKFVGESEQEVDENNSEKNGKNSASSEKKMKKERKQQEQSTLLDDEDLTELKIEPTDDASSSDSSSSDSSDDSDSDYDVERQQRQALAPKNNAKKDGFEIVQGGGGTGANSMAGGKKKKRKYKLTPEELALGTLMINSKKMRRDIVDAGWNRYAFNDENLPDWFVKDEAKHMRRPAVVPEELTLSYKKQLEEINTRPIKKVVEAKARKKKRALKKLEKARKKAENILENADVSEREKARQIKQLYKKARQEPKQEITYVVAKKHMTAKRMKRPAGVKGRYKIVDARMKKDLRAQKNKEKTVGRGKKKSGAAKGGKSSRNSGRPQGNRKGGKK